MIFHFSKHKKRILSAALCGSLMLSVGAPVLAFDENTITSSIFAEEHVVYVLGKAPLGVKLF